MEVEGVAACVWCARWEGGRWRRYCDWRWRGCGCGGGTGALALRGRRCWWRWRWEDGDGVREKWICTRSRGGWRRTKRDGRSVASEKLWESQRMIIELFSLFGTGTEDEVRNG